MSVVQQVTKGQPIKATWANSIVHEVNNFTSLVANGRAIKANSSTWVGAVSDGAFHIRYSNGIYSLNAGQVYINGHLVTNSHTKPTVTDGDTTKYVNSYNMYSSLENWYELGNYTPTSNTDFPYFFITITRPHDKITAENVNQVTASLVVTNDEKNKPTRPNDLEEYIDFIVIQVNTVEDGCIKQLISGSIYLCDTIPSIIEGDGISIKQIEPDVLEISSNGGGANVVLKEGEYIDIQKIPNGNSIDYTIHSYFVSIIGGDGINVTSSQHGRTTAYTISAQSVIIPDFDPEWFIVKNGKITFNEEKLIQLAQDIAATTTVNVNVTGIVDEVKTGSVQVDTTGIQNGTVTTNVSIV